MKNIGFYILIFLAIATDSNGQFSFVLEGTIGKYPIVMKLSEEEPAYFYLSSRRDIELQRTMEKNDTIILERIEWDHMQEDTVLETFLLKRTGNEWNGSWRANGRQLPVTLKVIDTPRYHFEQVPVTDDFRFRENTDRIYNKARLSGLSFVNDSVTYSGVYGLQWMHEKLSGISSFRVVAGYSIPLLHGVNLVLAGKQYGDLLDYFTCESREKDIWFDQHIDGHFFSRDFTSVKAFVLSHCGGAHPNYNDYSFTIDVKTGKEIVEIDELYWFTGKKPTPFGYNEEYHKYQDERSKAIVALLARLYPAEMKKPDNENDCDYTRFEVWNYPVWYLTDKGLYISPSFPHASHACNGPEFSVIPYSELLPYRNKERK